MVHEAEWMIDVPDRLNSDWLRNGCLLHRFPSALPNGASTNNSSRFFWLSSKLADSEACNDPSPYHECRFMTLLIYNCDKEGLKAAYTGPVSYVKDGLLFNNKHAHYESGNTPFGIWTSDLLCFSINEGPLCFKDGKLERADLNYLGKPNRARAFADSLSMVMFQYAARDYPLRIEHLLASLDLSITKET
ncbi:hypothetical protein SASPL_138389 [Salvia splendens]|uniref:Snurportin-1 n=1 Tax=Salvia splendens TaxID=180675 RepID=A0A8X8WV31_SALSN|nr:hypothetical protein SASPL_138389 [Salvia splendens]